MKTIELSAQKPTSKNYKKYSVIVDDDDYEELSKYIWTYHKEHKSEYAVTASKDEFGKYRTKKMHRMIMGINDRHILIDHVDGNGLNNQRSNLRLANYSTNQANKKRLHNKKSKYKGVYFQSNTQKWKSGVMKDGKYFHLGYFKTEEHAAMAYNIKAKELFGEFACINIIPDMLPKLNLPDSLF